MFFEYCIYCSLKKGRRMMIPLGLFFTQLTHQPEPPSVSLIKYFRRSHSLQSPRLRGGHLLYSRIRSRFNRANVWTLLWTNISNSRLQQKA